MLQKSNAPSSYWAVKVGSNLAAYFPGVGLPFKSFLPGGEEVGPRTLIRSFALHVAVFPFLWIILTSLHLWRRRKDGGLAAPQETENEKVPSSYHSRACGFCARRPTSPSAQLPRRNSSETITPLIVAHLRTSFQLYSAALPCPCGNGAKPAKIR